MIYVLILVFDVEVLMYYPVTLPVGPKQDNIHSCKESVHGDHDGFKGWPRSRIQTGLCWKKLYSHKGDHCRGQTIGY